jgi:hypothetical protein
MNWDVVVDVLGAWQSLIRLRTHKGWTLHSWQMFSEERPGNGCPYTEQMVCSVWCKAGQED